MSESQLLSNLLASYQQILQQESIEEARLLEEYQEQLMRLDQIISQLPVGRPRPNTIPVIFRKTRDENFISHYLAYVLNPQVNGLGSSPLQALLECVTPGSVNVDFEAVQIFREYALDSGIIDLLIDIDGTVLVGIENKIDSGEGVDQTVRYARSIRNSFHEIPHENQILIYLTPVGDKAGSPSFKSLSYQKLVQAFREIRYDWRIEIQKSVLWEDFLTHLEEYIIMKKEGIELSVRSKLYLEHLAIINDLYRAFMNDWPVVIEQIRNRVSEEIEQQGDKVSNWNLNFRDTTSTFYSSSWHQIFRGEWQKRAQNIHFEIFLGPNQLSDCRFPFMVDVEGNQSRTFSDKFAQAYDWLKPEYDRLGIQYRPQIRKIAIAWKEYTFSGDLSDLPEQVALAWREFQFLTPVIDSILAELETK